MVLLEVDLATQAIYFEFAGPQQRRQVTSMQKQKTITLQLRRFCNALTPECAAELQRQYERAVGLTGFMELVDRLYSDLRETALFLEEIQLQQGCLTASHLSRALNTYHLSKRFQAHLALQIPPFDGPLPCYEELPDYEQVKADCGIAPGCADCDAHRQGAERGR